MADSGVFTGTLASQWYILYPCIDSSQSVIFTQVTRFSTNVNATVPVYDEVFLEYLGCYTVKLFLGAPPSHSIINNNLIITDNNCNSCDNMCITVGGGSGYIKYLNIDSVETTASLPAKVCTTSIPFVSTPDHIIRRIYADCYNNCLIQCYELINCATGVSIYSNNQNLFTAYANHNVITLNELDGCWIVDVGGDCTCIEDVSINLVYKNCTACLPIVAYVLTNCENESLKKYSKDDLSAYIGKIVSLDCGDCWYVEQINYEPPQTQDFVVINSYVSCEECSRPYWIIYDCDNEKPPITTFSNMTAYEGKVIKLAGRTGCWSATPTFNPDYQNAVGVSVTSEFVDCVTCNSVTGCTCTRIKNTSSETLNYTYRDCSEIERTFSLVSGASSFKVCVNKWILKHDTTDILNEFGDCVEDPNNSLNKICPADLTGRMIKPGYTVPNCSTEKFERITCQTAETLYKQVLQQRYGISNCCQEEDENIILKKEVIDLQVLNDPAFNCSTINSCCSSAECKCSNCIS